MSGGYGPFAAARPIDDRGNGMSTVGGIETLSRFGLLEIPGVAGQLWINYTTALTSGPIGRLMMAASGTAATGVTLARMSVFEVDADDSVTLVARTANDTSIGTSQYATYDRPLATAGGYPATYNIIRGRRYAFGFLLVGDTPCSANGSFVLDGGEPPVPPRIITVQADIATSYAVGTLTAHYQALYIRGLPPAA